MHNPYVVGRWVCGEDHYDRQRLIEYLLQTQDTAIWVVGTRRMGKTSLLRQIELLTAYPESEYIPLFWDLQGCTTTLDLAEELSVALEYAHDRLADNEVESVFDLKLQADDVFSLLRNLSRLLQRQNRQLLLLVDEAEVLLEIGQQEPAWLARLRKVMQEGRQRTIIASTKLLSELTNQSRDWMTSPFLFGFHLVNLWTLKWEGAASLVRQSQGAIPVQVSDEVLHSILVHTNCHPYLTQFLCQRLYVEGEDGGYLRAVEDADLGVDHLLAGFIEHDYQRLNSVERRILCAVSTAGELTKDALHEELAGVPRARLETVLSSLLELGHLRSVNAGRCAIGNVYLQRWLTEQLASQPDTFDANHIWEAQREAGDSMDQLSDPQIVAVANVIGRRSGDMGVRAPVHVADAAEFYDIVCSFFSEIRHLVEQDDGHKLLVTRLPDGTPVLRSEEEVQIALKHWLRPMCRALNIALDREPLTGRGYLDFKLSIGHGLRCLVEVKLFNSSRLQEGVGIQLPLYLLADRATYGIYVPVFLNEDGYEEAISQLQRLAEERARSHGVAIGVIDIRAWKPKSASKAKVVEEQDRYAHAKSR